MISSLPLFKKYFKYRKVASSRLSWSHLRIFRLFMKGKFDANVLWPLAKRVQNWIVNRSTARNFTLSIGSFWVAVPCNLWPFGHNLLFWISLLLLENTTSIKKGSPRQILLELHNSPGYPSCQRPGFLSRKLSHDIMRGVQSGNYFMVFWFHSRLIGPFLNDHINKKAFIYY